MRAPRWFQRALGLTCGVAVAGLAAGLVVTGLDSAGASSSQVDLAPGTAWFASPATGRVSMIDGPTSTRVVVKDATAADHNIEIVQAGDDAFVVDRTDATMRRIDSGTFEVGAPISVGPTEDPLLRVEANAAAVWVISQSGTVVQQYDPQRGTAIGGPLSFPGTAGSAAITPDGTLWAVDATSGLVRSFRDDITRTDRTLTMSPNASIVAVGDSPVLVDTAGNTIHVLDPSTASIDRSTCLDVPADARAAFAGSTAAGSEWVIGVLPELGTAQIADIASDTCRPLALAAPTGTPAFGAPVAHGQRVFVPDFVDGTVVVLEPDATGDPVIARINLGLAGHQFRLFDHHSYVWFDDIDSDTAGVIHDDLTAQLVNKTSGDGLPTPPPDAEPEDDQLPRPVCTPTPNPAQSGQPVILNGSISPIGTEVLEWTWTLPDAIPPTAAGSQVQATWTTPGQRTVVLTAEVQQSPSSVLEVTAN